MHIASISNRPKPKGHKARERTPPIIFRVNDQVAGFTVVKTWILHRHRYCTIVCNTCGYLTKGEDSVLSTFPDICYKCVAREYARIRDKHVERLQSPGPKYLAHRSKHKKDGYLIGYAEFAAICGSACALCGHAGNIQDHWPSRLDRSKPWSRHVCIPACSVCISCTGKIGPGGFVAHCEKVFAHQKRDEYALHRHLYGGYLKNG